MTKGSSERGNYVHVSLVLHAGLSAYGEAKGQLSEEQCMFHPDRSTMDITLAGRRLQELGRKACIPLSLCFIDLQKAYDSVGRTFLWQVPTRFGVPPQLIRQFHDGIIFCKRAYMRNDDGVCSEWFEVLQGLRQGSVLSPLLFNVFFFAILLVELLIK